MNLIASLDSEAARCSTGALSCFDVRLSLNLDHLTGPLKPRT
jgi:hypothetical protein